MILDLKIDNLALGGRGVGRSDGKAVFVPYTVPGDVVRCRVVRDKKSYCEAELVEILTPSTARIAAGCPVFAECGGCQWQHLSYQEQLAWKERLFRETMSRALTVDDSVFAPIVASPQSLGYRCRAQFKCRMTDGGFVAGFYRSGSHYVVDIDACPLLAPDLNRLFAALKPLFSSYSLAHRVPQLDVSVDDAGQLALIVHFLDEDHTSLALLLEPIAREVPCAVYAQKGRKESLVELFAGPPQAIRPFSDMALRFPPGGFVQVNLDQNRRLVADVLAQVPPGSRVLDLYCGIGNFSLPIATVSTSVLGIEGYAPAIEMARENARRLGIDNAEFITDDAAAGLLSVQPGQYDIVLLDPPRSGAYDVARRLVELQPSTILYVSCDPMTLGRDLQKLCNNGYRPVALRAYDMFPQTAHIEGLAILELES